MNTLLQIATAIFIMWCIGPLIMIVAIHFLTARRKLTQLSWAASFAVMSFVITFLIMVTGIADNLRPDNPQSWLVPPIVGIVSFLFTLPSLQLFVIFKGYHSFDAYLEGETQKATIKMEARNQRPWRQRLKAWARRMWEGDYP